VEPETMDAFTDDQARFGREGHLRFNARRLITLAIAK